MLRNVVRCGVLAALALAAQGLIAADTKEAEDALKAKGLMRRAANFCVSEEAELAKLISGRTSDAFKRKKTVDDAQARAVAAKKALDDLENAGRQCRQEYDNLNIQLQALPATAPQRNKLIDRNNLLVAMLNAMPGRMQQAEKAMQDARLNAASQRESFIQYVVQLREKYDALVARYKTLEGDAEVKKAIEEYCRASNRICGLGPMKTTTETIRKLEGEVLSDEIPIYAGGGNLWQVFVTINGKEPPMPISIDTGASMISLPYKDAQAVGLTPTSQTRQITVSLADGRKIPAYEMKADSVRVGKFTVKDVRCGVMTPDCTEAMPLLGLSFFNNLNYKIHKTRGLLLKATIEHKFTRGRAPAQAGRGEKRSALDMPSDGGAAKEEPAADEAQTPAEKLAKLLAIDGMDEGSRRGAIIFRRRGGADLVFQPAKRGPAKTLQERFGDPDELRKLPDPTAGDEKARENPTWKIWTWGPVEVLVDETGTTRYFSVDKKPTEEKK